MALKTMSVGEFLRQKYGKHCTYQEPNLGPFKARLPDPMSLALADTIKALPFRVVTAEELYSGRIGRKRNTARA